MTGVLRIRNAVRVVSLLAFAAIMLQGKPTAWLILFMATIPLAVLLGRVYCGWICPMNTLMAPVNWAARKLKWERKQTPHWLRSGIGGWVVLVLSLLTMLAGRRLGVQLPVVLYLSAFAVVLTFWYRPEVWHKYLCPFGAVQSLPGRTARWGERVNSSECIGCRLCEKACTAEAVTVNSNHKAVIDSTHCLQCFDCQAACPKDAIVYGPATRKPSESAGNQLSS